MMGIKRSMQDRYGRRIKESIMAEMTAPFRLSITGNRLQRRLACYSGILGIMVFAFCSGCASVPEGKQLASMDSRTDEAGIVEKLGIKPVAIRLTAAGTMIDFRYRVVDPGKSLPAFDRKIRTYLIAQANGDRLDVPADTSLGALRSSSREPLAGKEYFIFFMNSGKLLQRGSKVTVVIGDFKIENLTIE
jgi:hypothetical protein